MDIKKQLVVAEQNIRERRFKQAEALCHKILKVMPDNIEAAFLLGSSHLKRLNYIESRKIFETILTKNPDHLDANNDLGVIFLNYKDFVSAEKYFRKVIMIDPSHVNALINLANISYHLEQWETAEALYKKALSLQPGNGVVLNNLGQLLIKKNRMSEGVDLMKQILNLSNPGPSRFVAYLMAKHICQWDVAERFRAGIVEILMKGSVSDDYLWMLGLTMLSDPNIDNKTMFLIARKTAEDFEKLCLSTSSRGYNKAIQALQASGKMRIGYLSGDFYLHVCTNFLRGLINYYDKDRFEVYCYSNTPVEDEITLQYKSNVDAFIDIRYLSDFQLAERIKEDNIHILVDLSGYTLGSRISVMSYRASPVQITYMGYPFTTGFDSIDYILSDPHLDGPVNAKYCIEKPLRLPEAFCAFGELFGEEIIPLPPFERHGVVTFGSLINTYKLSPNIIRAWSSILKRAQHTKMVLNHPNYEPEITRQNILREFEKNGITENRVRFIWEKLSDASHLRYYNDIDIALDLFPMTGGQTTVDALWMGVPVITLVGETHHERISYMVLKNININIEDLVAFSEEEYIQKAVTLANNSDRITELHQIIPEALNRSILCDPERFAGQLESAYIEAWNLKFPENRYDPGARRTSVEFVPVQGGAQIAVSGLIDDRFTYILKEQQGWFDSEYNFVLNIIQPDMRVIDIVSEAGAYAVPLAKKMAGGGKVWAISTNAAHTRNLLKSKIHNHLDSLQVLSNSRMGNLNLDREMVRHDWSNIDFVRINSGDGEQGLIQRGLIFFSQSSPLVMFGIKNREKRDLSIMELFKEQGYAPYRLIPGINLLVPFDSTNEPYELDDFSLHLFCCKKNRAEKLENLGLLVQSPLPPLTLQDCDLSVLQQYLSGLPYANGVMTHWLNISSRQKGWEMYFQALSLFAMAKTENQTAARRYSCIQGAHNLMGHLLTDQANVSRVMSMARVLTEMGRRFLAVKVLDHLAEFLETGKGNIVMNIDEPFLALSDELSIINPGDRIAEWIYASIIEQREKLRAFSSYYTGRESLEVLDKIEKLGFLSDEMKRRRQLIRMRHRMDAESHDTL